MLCKGCFSLTTPHWRIICSVPEWKEQTTVFQSHYRSIHYWDSGRTSRCANTFCRRWGNTGKNLYSAAAAEMPLSWLSDYRLSQLDGVLYNSNLGSLQYAIVFIIYIQEDASSNNFWLGLSRLPVMHLSFFCPCSWMEIRQASLIQSRSSPLRSQHNGTSWGCAARGKFLILTSFRRLSAPKTFWFGKPF